MNKFRWLVLATLFTVHCSLFSNHAVAQSAKQVLDKTAAVVSAKSGAKASFSIKGDQMNASGSIAIKGKKFQATTPQATVWFDGKTQWTYLKKNDEVNIANPSESELAAINPYNFIYLYKNGYKYTMEKKNGNFIVHLTASGKRSIQEMYITINQKTYIPSQIRMRQQKGWTTINITGFQQSKLYDGMFRFNSKDFPNAEVIDLR
ncbi:MAG: cell envelope biogenesis protein LolA [Prevotella sp.]|nr:cell envelope biogenesis protein LolA [Prevotella sp.]